MPNYRRVYLPGATYFFTVNLADRSQRLLIDHVCALRLALARAKTTCPFTIDAIVILPDHLHCLWTLPAGDCDFSKRWYWIKTEFHRFVRVGIYPLDWACDRGGFRFASPALRFGE